MNNSRLVFVLLAFTWACGGSVSRDGGSTAGDAGVGGQLNVGGKGGLANTGGIAATGGSVNNVPTGGALNTGGFVATGGDVSMGGKVATGGKSPTGGSISTGGKAATGGNASTGGNATSISTGGEAATGGSISTGGAVSSGGTIGTGGFAPTGGTGPNQSPGGVCQTASDCKMHDDCCTCDVYSAAADPPSCDMSCKQNACEARGIATDEVACVAGRCVFARSCNTSQVVCEVVMPTCPDGQIASAKGNCYGPCLPIGRCSEVSSCDVCKSARLACVTIEAEIRPVYHCVSTPAACTNNPTCGCMNVCTGGVGYCADPNTTALRCVCNEC